MIFQNQYFGTELNFRLHICWYTLQAVSPSRSNIFNRITYNAPVATETYETTVVQSC